MSGLVVFHHIPKTAGTSIRRILELNYRGSQIVEVNEPVSSVEWYRQFYNQLSWWRRRRLKCLVGHSAHYILPVVEPDARAFCMLREPVDRVVSLFYFVQEQVRAGRGQGRGVRVGREIIDRGWTLRDIYQELGDGGEAASELHELFKFFFNGQARAILGPHTDTAALGYVTTEDSEARGQLDVVTARYYTVGVQDDFAGSMRLLADRFGWKLPTDMGRENVGKRPQRDDVDSELTELVLRYNAVDAALHAHHRDLVERRGER